MSMGNGHPANILLWLFVIWLMLVWLTNYALRLIDDAANGVRETSAASAEMLADPYLDSRSWVHPLLAVAIVAAHLLHPQWPVAPTLLAAALLFPASIGACVMTGYARDALNPLTMLRVVRGIGPWYALLVVFVTLCVLLGLVLAHRLPPGALRAASLQLLLLIAYAAIGGALYERRLELGFDPRISPERAAMRVAAERSARRQNLIDELHKDLRARAAPRAVASSRQWLGNAEPAELAGDVHAFLAAGRNWSELRDYPLLLQGLLPVLFELKQPTLACAVAEAGLAIAPGFTAATEADAVALVGYALDTGRRRAAAKLLDNYFKRNSGGPAASARLLALRERLQPPA
jgi:hypothetical protein